jgi:3-dehydroquinate synthetase
MPVQVPTAKQYEITHQIGEVSVTVRAPSAAECEQIVARLDKSTPDLIPPRELSLREEEMIKQLRAVYPSKLNRRAFISSLGGIVVSDVAAVFAVAVPAEAQDYAILILSKARNMGEVISVNGVRVP